MKIDHKNKVTLAGVPAMVDFLVHGGTACRFVSMLTRTEVRTKRGCPFAPVIKLARRNGLLNVRFAAAVGRRLARLIGAPEGSVEYTPGETWYVHVPSPTGAPTPLVVHKERGEAGGYYIQYFPLRAARATYIGGNGLPVSASEVAEWEYAKRGTVEWKPAVCVFKLESVIELRAAGLVFEPGE